LTHLTVADLKMLNRKKHNAVKISLKNYILWKLEN